MRFAYIDSQGNEVTIPSVDALALRIELGAIGSDTELYDAQADRWGPAHTHEIFHTLSRDAGGDAFLVPSPTRAEEVEEPEPDAGAVEGGEPRLSDPEPPAAEGDPQAPGIASLGLTLNPPGPSSGGPGPDLAAPGEAPDPSAAEPPAAPGAPSAELGGSDALTFDLAADAPPKSGAGSPPSQGEAPTAAAGSGPEGAGSEPEEEPLPSFDSGFADGGFELEPSMDFMSPGDPVEPDRLDLEPPMSAFDPSGPPAWMEQDGPAGGEGAMDFSQPTMDADLGRPAAPAPSPGPAVPGRDPDRPSAPRRRAPAPRRIRRRGGGGKWLLGTVVLALLATGGYYGWEMFGDSLRSAASRPPVVIPPIPPELEAPMRSLAEDALHAMFADIESQVLDTVPQEPSPDWLAGVYLGNASRFPEVVTFWSGIATLAQRLGDLEVGTFHAEYVTLADSADFDDEERALMVARADSGFMATREERLRSYRLLGRLADASLALHGFLVENEASIAYTPATAFSGNPVEEAVPATEELGDRMWDLVADITNALDALGTLDRVTRERLSTVLLERIDSIGIR